MAGAALLENGNLTQEADVIACVVLLQLLHGYRLHVAPLRTVHLRIGANITNCQHNNPFQPFLQIKVGHGTLVTIELAIPDENALDYGRDTVMIMRARE